MPLFVLMTSMTDERSSFIQDDAGIMFIGLSKDLEKYLHFLPDISNCKQNIEVSFYACNILNNVPNTNVIKSAVNDDNIIEFQLDKECNNLLTNLFNPFGIVVQQRKLLLSLSS